MWFAPVIYLTRARHLHPLQVILREMLIVETPDSIRMAGVLGPARQHYAQTVQAAVSIVSIIPILCLYPWLQKYFVQGIMIGALKG